VGPPPLSAVGPARPVPRSLKLEASARALWAIAVPIVLAELSETIVEATDTAFLGRFGTLELAAVGLGAAIYEVTVFLTFGLADGIQIVAARRAGQERPQAVGDAFFHGASLLVATSIAVLLFLLLGAQHVTAWLIRSDAVRAGVNAYVGILAYAAVFHCLNMAYSALYVGIGRTRVLIGATLALALTNVVCDYLLIFGHAGLPRLGLRGAAFGSLLAETTGFLYFTVGAVAAGDAGRFGLFRRRTLDRKLTRLMLTIAWPAALERLLGTGRWFAFFVILERLGEAPLAVANVVHAVYALLLLPVGGLAEAVCTTVSNLLGQARDAQVGALVRRTAKWALLVVLPIIALVLVAPGVPLAVFTADPDLLRRGAGCLRVLALAIVVVIPAELVLGAVMGTGDTRSTLAIELVLTVVMLASAYSAGPLLGLPLEVVWASEIVGWVACLGLSYAWLNSERRKPVAI